MRRVPAAVVMIGAVIQAAAASQEAQSLPRMVATERAFAAATAEIGVRDGFLSFFADDAVQIQRGATVTLAPARAALAALPLQKLPVANQLLWEPFTGHVSADGTLGWLTGAFVRFNQAQRLTVGQGAYFSVWKVQPNGTWRVWLDEGITLPQIWQNASPFRAAPEPDAGTAGTPNESVEDAERAVAAGGDAWRARLAADVRLHREGVMPLVGRADVTAWSARQPVVSYAVMKTEAAASGDLAIVIGSLTTTGVKAPGSWVRVWKRDTGGRWRIVFQTETVG